MVPSKSSRNADEASWVTPAAAVGAEAGAASVARAASASVGRAGGARVGSAGGGGGGGPPGGRGRAAAPQAGPPAVRSMSESRGRSEGADGVIGEPPKGALSWRRDLEGIELGRRSRRRSLGG